MEMGSGLAFITSMQRIRGGNHGESGIWIESEGRKQGSCFLNFRIGLLNRY